jgi:signal transduction histidine kinase
MTLRPPDGLWSVRGTLLVFAAVVGPTLASVALVHDGDLPDTLAAARTILIACGALVATGLLVGHGRLAGNDESLWLATATGVLAATGLARGGYGLTHPQDMSADAATILLGVVGLNVVLAGILLCARRWGGALNPLVVGVPLAVALLVAQQLVITGDAHVDSALLPLITVLLCCAVLALAVAVQRLDALSSWARDRISLAICLGVASRVLLLTSPPVDDTVRAVVSVVVALAGSLLLATTAAALLREVMTDGQRQLADLQRRLAAAEQERRIDSARLHDITSLVAGIASASRLVRELPPSDHRAGLEVMVLAELERLQRLLADRTAKPGRVRGWARRIGRPAGSVGTFNVAEVAGRIALVHRARGRDVQWHVNDVRVAGDPDDLAAILDVLIDNAASHGSADEITVSVRRLGQQVEIAVADDGPGVPDHLQQSLFDWGIRGPESDGSGIGLASASALAARLGGRLELDAGAPGTRMVVTLPEDRTQVPEELAVAGF